MVGHFVAHDFVGGARVAVETILAEEVEFALEIGIGERTRVLEFAQTLVGEEMQVAIRNEVFQGTATVVGFVVLRVREPAEEIVRGIVERVIDKVMTVTEIGFAFAVKEDLSLAIENLAHEDMA
jgi:hypothetical protein